MPRHPSHSLSKQNHLALRVINNRPHHRLQLNRAADAQLPDLLQDLLDAGVEVALGVLVAGVGVEVLLDLGHAAVGLGAEAQLDLDEGLEAGVEVGDAQVDELRQLRAQLLVQLVVRRLGHVHLLLGPRQLRHVLVRLLCQLLDLGAQRVVVEQLVAALLNACVDRYDAYCQFSSYVWVIAPALPLPSRQSLICLEYVGRNICIGGHTLVYIGEVGAEPCNGI